MRLDEIVAALEAAVVSTIEDADTGASVVILGEEADIADLKSGAIWVIPEDAQITHAGSAIAEEWTWPIRVFAMVEDDAKTPQERRAQAAEIASKATAALIAARTTRSGSELSPLVSDVVRLSYMPGGDESLKQEGVQYAGYLMGISFRHREET